jgi:hypothetical protein
MRVAVVQLCRWRLETLVRSDMFSVKILIDRLSVPNDSRAAIEYEMRISSREGENRIATPHTGLMTRGMYSSSSPGFHGIWRLRRGVVAPPSDAPCAAMQRWRHQLRRGKRECRLILAHLVVGHRFLLGRYDKLQLLRCDGLGGLGQKALP